MGSLRTLLLAAAALAASDAMALPASPVERVRIFADCAGRLDALEHHQWMVAGPASEITRAERIAFSDILAALIPDARAVGLPRLSAVSWRIEARAAQRALLETAEFSNDPARAADAGAMAEQYLITCRQLLLSS